MGGGGTRFQLVITSPRLWAEKDSEMSFGLRKSDNKGQHGALLKGCQNGTTRMKRKTQSWIPGQENTGIKRQGQRGAGTHHSLSPYKCLPSQKALLIVVDGPA